MSVGQNQLEAIFQQIPHRLPVHAGRLHRHDLHAQRIQPVGHGEYLGAGGAERLDEHLPVHTCRDLQAVLVHVDAGTTRVLGFHRTVLQGSLENAGLGLSNLLCVLPIVDTRRRAAQQFGVRNGIRVRLSCGFGTPR